MGFFSNEEFVRYKKCTQPVYQTPASVQQMLDISAIHENGIFEIERNNGSGNRKRKFDRVYSFSDLNYADQDRQRKDGICFQLRKFLNSMDTDFKITVQCEPRDVNKFRRSLLQDEEKSAYPELARYNNEMIQSSLSRGQENVRKQRYLTVSTRCKSIEEAEGWFDTFEHTALPIFHAMGSEMVPLDAVQRFQCIRNYFFADDGEESFILPFEEMVQAGRDFKNSIVPHSLHNHKSYMEYDEECMRILYAAELPTRLNEERLIFELTDFPFYTCLTLDTACIPREVLRGKISNSNFYNEAAIGQEIQANANMGNFYSEPSYLKKKKQADLKKYMNQIEEDDENGFYVGILIAVRGADKAELDANTAEVRRICKKHSIQIVSYYDQQIQALNTLLPIGARRVNNMRAVLTSSYLAFQPLDSTSKLSLQQERTNEKYIEPEHPEFYRRIEETSPLEDQLGLVYTDQPQAEPKISYHERDIHNLRLFTQRYILQKEMENFANQAQVQVTSGNVERPQTTGELAGIYENEMRESPSISQVSRQIETSEMLFSEYTEPAMPDILKRDSFSMQESYHRNTEDNFAQDNGSNATVWSVSAPKEKIFSPEVSLMHEEQVPAYIPEHKTAEEQISLQEQRMKNLRLFAQKYAKQKATNQIPSVYLEHQESNSLQMGTPFNINSGVQENFPSREQQEQRAAEDQAEQQRQEILRQNDIYQQTMHRRSEEELFPEVHWPIWMKQV